LKKHFFAIFFLTTSLQMLVFSKRKVVEDSGLRQSVSHDNNFQKCMTFYFY
jgi:hypothetical protein